MTVREFLNIVELRTKVVSVSSLLIGGILALMLGGASAPWTSWPVALLFVVTVLAIDMGTTAFNTFFDHWNGTDRKGRNFERDKVLVHGRTPAGYALLTGLGLYGAAAVFGLVLGALSGFELIVYGALGMLVGFLYSGGPRPIATTPFGEVFAGGFLGGGLVCLTVYVLIHRFDAQVAALAVPSTLAVAAILTVNNTCDLESDREAGRKTLSILIGPGASVVLIALLGLASYVAAGILLAARAGLLAVVPLVLGASVFLLIFRGMVRRGFSLRTKGPNMGAVTQAFALFTVTFATALGWGSYLDKSFMIY